jgi:hypothetical protein
MMHAPIPVIAAGLLLFCAMSGCTGAAKSSRSGSGPVLPRDVLPANPTGLSDSEFQRATRLHANKCARCHKFYNPAPYTEAAWNSWMTKMGKKAHLKPDEQALLVRYLSGFRTSK